MVSFSVSESSNCLCNPTIPTIHHENQICWCYFGWCASCWRGNMRWICLVSEGTPIVDDKWFRISHKKDVVLLQPGYEGVRELNFEDKVVILLVKIKKGDDGPVFVIENQESGEVLSEGREITKVMKSSFTKIGYSPQRKIGGLEFFGLMRSDVLGWWSTRKAALESSATIGRLS